MQKKIFFTYVILILFLSSIIGFYSVKICADYFTSEYQEYLLNESKAAASVFKEDYDMDNFSDILNFTKDFSERFHFRITVIHQDGKVLCDSQEDATQLENHADRKEVKDALKGDIAVTKRYSTTANTNYIYVAIPVESKEKIVVLRFSRPIEALTAVRNQMMIYIFLSVSICSVIAFFLAYYFSKRVSEPLDELTKAVEEISEGKYDKKICMEYGDQIGALTQAFNRMSGKLSVSVKQLEKENKKMEAIVNSMLDGIVAVDGNNNILMMNSMCRSLFSISQQNVIGAHFYDVFQDEALRQLVNRSQKEKKPIVEEMVFKSAYHADKILCIYVNPITERKTYHGDAGIVLVFQNVTQIRKLEKLRSDFVSNVTHELKTPLTSIIGFTDTLRHGAIENKEAAMHFLDIIDIETKRLYRLIEDILSLSEIETRKEDVNVSPEYIQEICRSVIDLLKPQAQAKGLELQAELDETIPLYMCNRDRISQMLINLIENAIKYTEKGYVKVKCKNQDSFLEIIVEDTGIGIPEDSRERIFERFYRVDKGRSRKAGGTGLGLSIVKHILMLYDGRVSVTSGEECGSRFTVILPYGHKTIVH
jgi:two-component system phosphate regulon sensor histidine kinase PhoR